MSSRMKWLRTVLAASLAVALLSGGLAWAGKPPSDPENLNYTETETSITLTWESGGGEIGFKVGYDVNILPPEKLDGFTSEDVSIATSYEFNGLTSGTTYGFRVCAYSSNKTSGGATLLVTLGGADPTSEEYEAEYENWCSEEGPVFAAFAEGEIALDADEIEEFTGVDGEPFEVSPIGSAPIPGSAG